jgi:hypothetical protein
MSHNGFTQSFESRRPFVPIIMSIIGFEASEFTDALPICSFAKALSPIAELIRIFSDSNNFGQFGS